MKFSVSTYCTIVCYLNWNFQYSIHYDLLWVRQIIKSVREEPLNIAKCS